MQVARMKCPVNVHGMTKNYQTKENIAIYPCVTNLKCQFLRSKHRLEP